MCRIGAIKSKVPVEPAKALYLMLPQQEGHDNSGYAMVMQDLYGVFEGHKDKPLLSLACTPVSYTHLDVYKRQVQDGIFRSRERSAGDGVPQAEAIPCVFIPGGGQP